MLVFLLAAGALMFSLHHLGGCYVSKQIMILKILSRASAKTIQMHG